MFSAKFTVFSNQTILAKTQLVHTQPDKNSLGLVKYSYHGTGNFSIPSKHLWVETAFFLDEKLKKVNRCELFLDSFSKHRLYIGPMQGTTSSRPVFQLLSIECSHLRNSLYKFNLFAILNSNNSDMFFDI